MASRLEELGAEFRKKQIVKNPYTNNDQYTVGHDNALSNGDNKGKGENNGAVGSAADISKRNELLIKNKYGNNKPYSDSNA
jgi:hypothetical protein